MKLKVPISQLVSTEVVNGTTVMVRFCCDNLHGCVIKEIHHWHLGLI